MHVRLHSQKHTESFASQPDEASASRVLPQLARAVSLQKHRNTRNNTEHTLEPLENTTLPSREPVRSLQEAHLHRPAYVAFGSGGLWQVRKTATTPSISSNKTAPEARRVFVVPSHLVSPAKAYCLGQLLPHLPWPQVYRFPPTHYVQCQNFRDNGGLLPGLLL